MLVSSALAAPSVGKPDKEGSRRTGIIGITVSAAPAHITCIFFIGEVFDMDPEGPIPPVIVAPQIPESRPGVGNSIGVVSILRTDIIHLELQFQTDNGVERQPGV